MVMRKPAPFEVERRRSEHSCIGCGKVAPLRASRKGWLLVCLSDGGKGRRWYRNCGCLPRSTFFALLDALYDMGLNKRGNMTIAEVIGAHVSRKARADSG